MFSLCRFTGRNTLIRPPAILISGLLTFLASISLCRAAAEVTFDPNDLADADADFRFKRVSPPSRNDAAVDASFTVIAGERDPNSGPLAVLTDGRVPSGEDAPQANFFFRPQTDGGLLLLDLGRPIRVKRVNSYSWHHSGRGPQLYELYAADGAAADFKLRPGREQLENCGWQLVAKVDTRPAAPSQPGGQYGVSIADPAGVLGHYRYLLFDMHTTDPRDPFGNTFYSEIDVIDADASTPEDPVPAAPERRREIVSIDSGLQVTIDTTDAPDLTDWARTNLVPVAREWYPRIIALLPSRQFQAPPTVAIVFRDDLGGTPAATSGARIGCNSDWFRRNLDGEAVGSVVHEMVHVVQQYGNHRRTRRAAPTPGWLVEGIADYIRWFKFEPQTKGAEIGPRNLSRVRYDASYRVSANFLNWVCETYESRTVTEMNAALREGRYREELWSELTGKTLEALGAEWRQHLEKKLAHSP